MCFGSNKTTTDSNATSTAGTSAQTNNTAASTPSNPTINPAVTGEVNAATSLAQQPLQLYQGSLVAPLTDTQNQAISQIGANSTYTPTPFSADAVNQYESPYTTDVLNTTEAAENLQDKQQQQSLAGGITAAGAFGGDRAAVVQSELGGQQDVANNQTNANIENEGYTQALGEFNTENQLGLSTQQSNLAGATDLLNAGTLEQQVNQENLNVPYEQYLQEEAYPYQNLDFESGILGSAASTTGTTTNQSGSSSGSSTGTNTGTNTQSTSQPIGSQLLGLGLSAASFLKKGGRARLASGGGLSDAAYVPLPTPIAMSSFIPTNSSSGGGGLQPLSAGNTPTGPSLSTAGAPGSSGGTGGGAGANAGGGGLSQGMSEGNQIGSALESPGLGGYLGTDPTYTGTNAPLAEGLFGNAGGFGGVFGSAPATVSAASIAGPSDFSGLLDSALPDLAGLKKGGRTRLADGGIDDTDTGDSGDGFDALLARLYQPDQDSVPVASPTSLASPAAPAPAGATAMSLADTPPAWRAQATNYAPDPSQSTSLAGPTPSDIPTGYVPLGPDAPISLGAGPSPSASTSPTWDDGTPVIASDDEGQGSNDAPASLAAAPAAASNTSNPGLGTAYAPKIIQNAYAAKPDWRRALLTAGTSMMAANTGNGLGNIGAGFKAGANEYYDQLDKDNNPTVDHSGPTTLVRYADGTVVDTGLPTEAALAARASSDYRNANMDSVKQTREDAIAERAKASADTNAQRTEAAKQASLDRANALQVARINANAGRFGQPIPGNGVDASGKTIPGAYIVNGKTGDLEFHPGVDLTQKAPAAGSAAAGLGGREGVMFNRVVSAGNSATAAAKNIMELPLDDTSTGIFGGRHQGGSLLGAAKESLTNTLTSQAVQDYNAMVPGVTRNLGALETQGLAVPGSMTHSMDGTLLKEGDSELTKMRKMAEMRQIVETNLEPQLSNPRIPPEQKQLVQKIIGQIQTAIPFTHHDITTLENAKSGTTIGDVVKARGLGGVPASAAAYLKQNPSLRGQFDAKYGAGSAAKILGQ